MTQERNIALVDELLESRTENNCLELKHNNTDPKMIGKLCSALSNSARIANENSGYILWGVRDNDRSIVGTDFNPEKNQAYKVLRFKLAQKLNPKIECRFSVIDHPKGRVVLLEVPATTNTPTEFDGTAYIRIGSATPKLAQHPDQYERLIKNLQSYTWEKDIAKTFLTEDEVLHYIDYPTYFKLNKKRLPDNRQGILKHLLADKLITQDVGGRWNILNLGAILFAADLDQFNISLARKGVRFVAYQGNNKASVVLHRKDGSRGYAAGFKGLIDYINNFLPDNEHIGTVFREKQVIFPEIAIRELVANALIHQDMTITGAGPQIELFSDRIEIINPGKPLIEIDRMIDLPPRSRNEAIAALMRRMGFCEEQGSGLDKVIINIELYQLPAPKFQTNQDSMQVALYMPRPFAKMTPEERVRACYQHAIIKYISQENMKNSTLCERFGIDKSNAAQASKVIKLALDAKVIKVADIDKPRVGYVPSWA